MSTIGNRNASIHGWFENIQSLAASGLSAMKRVHSARRSRTATRHLLTHDDRMLDDMGVSRNDVVQALAVSWDTDPATALAEIRRRRLQADRQGLCNPASADREVVWLADAALCMQLGT